MFCVSVSYIEKACKTVYTLLWGYVGLVRYGVVTFYPASGRREPSSGAFNVTGSTGYAWSCAVTGADGYYLSFNSSGVLPTNGDSRAYGRSVRCVQNLLLVKKSNLLFG